MDWFVQLPEHVGELAKTWMGITILVALGAIGVAKILQFGVEVVSSIVSWLRWRGSRVTVIQGGEIVAIGTVISFGHQWLTLCRLEGIPRHVRPARPSTVSRCLRAILALWAKISGRGEQSGYARCAFCRNRIDLFRDYVPGDERFLVNPGASAAPSPSDPKADDEEDDEGDDGGE